MIENKQNFYKDLVNYFGERNQLIIAIEELSELQKEICKILREKDKSRIGLNSLIEEIADVKVMIEQLEFIFNCKDDVEFMMNQKLERTNKRYLKKNFEITTTYVVENTIR